jgi:putative phage-type endonuclease
MPQLHTELAMTTPWEQWRSLGIGASEVAGVLGISPWATPYSVWQAKVSGDGGGTSGNAEAMRWGQLLETAILQEVERRLGIHPIGEQTACTHRTRPFAICTVDAFYTNGVDHRDGVIEVKTTSDPRWTDVPDHYQAQVQWQLEVTDLDKAWVACLHNGRKLSLWPIDRDRDIGAGLLEIVENFWVRHVQGGEPPPVDGRPATTAAIARRYADTQPELVADLTHIAHVFTELHQVRDDIKTLDEQRDQLENLIKTELGEAEAGNVDGVRAVTWKTSTSKRIDTGLLRDERPEIAAEYTTEQTVRRFLLKDVGVRADG